LIAVLYSGVAQTFSKGPMLASFFVIAAVTGGLLIMGKRTMAGRSAGVAGLCAILVAVNVVVLPLLPLADSFAEKTYAGWIGPKPAPPTVAATPSPSTPPPVAATPVQPRPPVAAADPPKPAAAKAPPPQPVPSASEVLEKTLRVNIESTMTQLDDGRIAWHTAECETLCAGQRTRLWTAGWQVVREHWLTGIGFGGWRAEMKRLLQYPFSSPHNATLHMWGMFGLAGLALNLGLYAVLLRRLAGFGRWLEPTAGHMAALATGIYLAICMAGEAVETTEIFSLSRFGFFIWIMLAMHTSSAGSVTSAPAAAPSPAR
jgi:O-antigen ligase